MEGFFIFMEALYYYLAVYYHNKYEEMSKMHSHT